VSKQLLSGLIGRARALGYQVLGVEQPRSNRWVLLLGDGARDVVVLAQRRSLVGAADVADLADLVRLRRVACGILLAIDGEFSPIAHRSAGEQGVALLLANELPPRSTREGAPALNGVAVAPG
jgi:hypothetical protein